METILMVIIIVLIVFLAVSILIDVNCYHGLESTQESNMTYLAGLISNQSDRISTELKRVKALEDRSEIEGERSINLENRIYILEKKSELLLEELGYEYKQAHVEKESLLRIPPKEVIEKLRKAIFKPVQKKSKKK